MYNNTYTKREEPMLVEELMATDVVTTTPHATLKEVDELFNLNSISGAPVVDDGV